MSNRVTLSVGLLLTAVLGGCSVLPKDGPSVQQVVSGRDQNFERNYLVVDMSHPVVAALARFTPEPFSKRFASQRPAPGQRVGIGDVLSVTLFESGQGGLFSSDNGARVALPVSVDSSGAITIPYAGRIEARGRTTAEIERAIVAALQGKAIQPQALVTITTVVSDTYVVGGDVNGPGRYPVTPVGDRVLDAIAAAGGSKYAAYETQVQLQRGSRSGSVLMKRLVDNPSENVYVHPGDKIFLLRSPLSYTVFGSALQPGAVTFDTEQLSLLEALARTGGLDDQRSDVKGVFLFRYEADAVARAIDGSYDGRFGPYVPVVYRVNMENPDAYFFAKGFAVRDKDVIYLASATGNQIQKFFSILQGARSAGSSVTTVSGK